MNFSSQNLYNITQHNAPITNIYHFPDNDSDHFISLSKDTELREWIISEEIQEISSGKLERPDDKYLINIGIEIPLRKTAQAISKSIFFNNMIAIGYKEGLILIWAQSLDADDVEVIKNLNKNHKIEKNYLNEYNLDFILPGHTGMILDMIYLKKQNILVTSGEECVIKFWNLTEGIPVYHFNLDLPINFLIFPEMRKIENLFLVSTQNHLVKIDLTIQPYNFTSNFFKFNKFINYKDFNEIILLGSNGSLIIFDNSMKFKNEVIVEENSSCGVLFVEKWKNFYLILREDKNFLFGELSEKKMKILFKIEIPGDIATSSLLEKDLYFIGTRDFKIFCVDLKKEFELYLNRFNMIEEEKKSIALNVYVNNKLARSKNRFSGKNKQKRETSALQRNLKSISLLEEKNISNQSYKTEKKVKTRAVSRNSNSKKDKQELLPSIKEQNKKKKI